MRLEFTVIDDNGKRYSGAADLGNASVPLTDGKHSATHREEPLNPQNSAAKGLPDHILRLRETGFFREPRTSTEVHVKLQDIYSCQPDRVQMALLRLQRRRELRKAV